MPEAPDLDALPSTISALQGGTADASEPTASYTLMTVSGPDRGAMFEVDGATTLRTLLGQSPVCEVRLKDPQVSRRHVVLELDGGSLRISDLGSTNGTFVDNVRIVEALLSGGETLRVGETSLRVERSLPLARPPLPTRTTFGRILGASPAMRRLYSLWEKLAASDIPVILEGETGTGKEVLAEALHEEGPRRQGPFVVFDCTAVAPTLLESELFGHEKGAFTGAVAPRAGMLEQAHGGTLLIDEIGDFDMAMQPKLLRAVERGEIRRVGGTRVIKVDVRLLAATRRNLDEEVQHGRFRDDLFHRLAVARTELPPLRRRQGDVTLLARAFCAEFKGNPDAIPPAVYRRWEAYPWPGNVRELRNAVMRQIAFGDWGSVGGQAPEEDGRPVPALDESVTAVLEARLPLAQAREQVVEAFERRYLERVLSDNDGNVRKAAIAAGVGRRYFQRLRAKTR